MHVLDRLQRWLRRFSPSERIGVLRNDDPRFGWSLLPSSQGWHVTKMFQVRYTIDAEGSRVTPDPATPRGEILTLGCSYTFGHGVEDDEVYVARLAAGPWADYKVINRAALGWGTVHALLALEDELARRRPKLVLYGWIAAQARRNYLRKAWLEQLDIYDARSPYVELVGDRLIPRGLVGPDDGLENAPEVRAQEVRVTLRMVREMDRLCREAGVPWVVLLLPDVRLEIFETAVNAALLKALEEHDIPYLDLRDAASGFFAEDPHPIPSWHAAIAEAIASAPSIRNALEGS